jgi:hypothetical protein
VTETYRKYRKCRRLSEPCTSYRLELNRPCQEGATHSDFRCLLIRSLPQCKPPSDPCRDSEEASNRDISRLLSVVRPLPPCEAPRNPFWDSKEARNSEPSDSDISCLLAHSLLPCRAPSNHCQASEEASDPNFSSLPSNLLLPRNLCLQIQVFMTSMFQSFISDVCGDRLMTSTAINCQLPYSVSWVESPKCQ